MVSERITAPLVNKKIDAHLQRHELKIDPKLHNIQVCMFGESGGGGLNEAIHLVKDRVAVIEKIERILVGPDGNNGLNSEVQNLKHRYDDIDKRLEKMEKNINWAVLLILGSFLTSIARLVLVK